MTHDPETRFYVESPWGQLHARSQGTGPLVVLLHQTPWTSLQYHRIQPLLAALGFRTVAIDTPGYGQSSAPPAPPSIDDYADALDGLFASLGERPVLVGHHTGAIIAAARAARHGQGLAGLIVHGLPLYTEAERAERLARPHFDQTPAADGSHFTRRWARLQQVIGAAAQPDSLHLATALFFLNGPREYFGHEAAYRHDLGPTLDAIRTPTLLVTNTGDMIHDHAARVRARRPDFASEQLTGGTAEYLLEHPDRWVEAIIPHLRRMLA